ncbi:hypothetical protein AAFF_G00089710 [Aldrovandia affinis]|uniref:Uncharacterized protein n=1 Tax=Aldrovandia affinis TaxID=143900 RepID=A0AAD7R1F7_9TELE|nr:hypothetical protein AAFF_G00089710 [Aldrovandia affinis]
MIVGTTQLFIEFCVEDRKDVLVNYGKSKFDFSCLGGTDSTKHLNEVDLFGAIDQKGQTEEAPSQGLCELCPDCGPFTDGRIRA